MRKFRIRDPIHGFIELLPDEQKAIGAATFQRLRGIRQLAMTNLVYPGALHTRFEHSLGVCHIAGRMAEEVELSDEDQRVVRAAALLHDIGHGPFSHVSEAVLDARNGVRGVHEAISVAIIRTDEQLRAALGKEICERAADMLAHSGDFAVRSVQRDIVSGPSDADKLDYLLRDSYFAGVNYGQYDLNRLIDTAVVINDGGLETYLGFAEDGVWAVEGLLLARHHMHRQVYGHKTRIATDIMVQRALTLGIDDGAVNPGAFRVPIVESKPAPDAAFLEAYLQQTDESVMYELRGQTEDTYSRDMAERLTQRRLLRRGARISFQDVKADLGGPRIGRILDAESVGPKLPALEEGIAEKLGCPTHLVALRIDEPGNPVHRTPDAGVGSKDILLSFEHHPPAIIQDVSEIFRNAMEESQRSASLYIPRTEGVTYEQARDLLWNALMTL